MKKNWKELHRKLSMRQSLTSDSEYLDRVRGMLAAHFLGDALGAPFEFRWQNPAEYVGRLERPPDLRTRFQGTMTGVIGQTTDDTAMTLIVLHHLLARDGQYDDTAIVQEYHAWTSGAKMIGRNTRELLKFKAQPANVPACFDRRWTKKFSDPEVAEQQRSNGALMRCTPFALVSGWKEFAYVDCFLTNPSQLAWECEKLYLMGLRRLLRGTDPEEVEEYLASKAEHPELQAVFAEKEWTRDLRDLKGYVVHAFACFVTAIRCPGTLSEFYEWLIRQGGDTDTNAAIAGAALGARLGFTTMMKEHALAENWEILAQADVSESELESRPDYQGCDILDLL